MTEAAAPVVPEVPASPSSSAAPPVDTPKVEERTFSQKELDEIVEKRLAKERRKREAERAEKDLFKKLYTEKGGELPGKKPAEAPADREPVRGDFEHYEDFVAAKAEYRAGKTADAKLAQKEKEAEERRVKEAQAKEVETFRTRERENAKGIEDYDEVVGAAVSDPNSAVARISFDPVANADNPAKILHHLATHPDEAERIASLPMGQQAREIWKLDATLSAAKPAPAKPSAAPAPINPVGGGKAAPAGAMPDPNTDQSGWLKWRNDQIRAKRAGGKTA